jgi:hypothetical protein
VLDLLYVHPIYTGETVNCTVSTLYTACCSTLSAGAGLGPGA